VELPGVLPVLVREHQYFGGIGALEPSFPNLQLESSWGTWIETAAGEPLPAGDLAGVLIQVCS